MTQRFCASSGHTKQQHVNSNASAVIAVVLNLLMIDDIVQLWGKRIGGRALRGYFDFHVVDDGGIAAHEVSEHPAAEKYSAGHRVDPLDHVLLCASQLRQNPLIGRAWPH